jgi:hypothetical protein
VENGCALHPKLLREATDVPTQMECFKYALELGLEVDYDENQAFHRGLPRAEETKEEETRRRREKYDC